MDSNPKYNSEPVTSDVCASYVESILVRELIVAEWCLSMRTSPVSIESKSGHSAILRQKSPQFEVPFRTSLVSG